MLYKKYDYYEKYGDFERYDKKPLFLYLFCHDDVSESYRRIIYRDYLKACMYELEFLLEREIIVELHYAVPGFTDMNYKTDVGQEQLTLMTVRDHCGRFARENNLSYARNYRYGLITMDKFSNLALGMAFPGQNCFMACLQGYQSIAHELGHTLDARHEDAKVSFGLPFTQTYMHHENNPFYAKDYRYSDANRKRMVEFLASVD